jgi:hypothetical protein
MTEIVFAQLCKTVSSVEEANSVVLDLYGTASSETPMDISAVDFINLFYSKVEDSNFKFNMDLDASGLAHCKKYLDLSGAWYEKNNSSNFQISERVPSEYARMMGIEVSCFDTASLMKIRSELLNLEDLCAVTKKSSTLCCSLTLDELVDILNDGSNDYSREKPSTLSVTKITVNSNTHIGASDAQKILNSGDKLVFSILVTNPSNKVKDIEIKLHFNIKY